MRKFLLFLALGPVLASCGGRAIGRQGNMNQGGLQMALPAFNTLLTGLRPGQAPTLPTQGMPAGITTAAIRPLAVPSCVTETPDTIVDKDSDGIALLKLYKYDCKNELVGTDTYKYKGTTQVEDLDDTKKWSLGGYKVTFDADSEYEAGPTAKGQYSYKGYWSSQASGASMIMKSDYTARVAAILPAHPTVDYSMRAVYNFVITGANDTTPWLAGKWTGSGLYELSGTFYYENESTNARETKTDGNVTLEFRSDELEYDQACAVYYKSGSWIFRDGAGNELKIVYDCATSTKYLNGTLQP